MTIDLETIMIFNNVINAPSVSIRFPPPKLVYSTNFPKHNKTTWSETLTPHYYLVGRENGWPLGAEHNRTIMCTVMRITMLWSTPMDSAEQLPSNQSYTIIQILSKCKQSIYTTHRNTHCGPRRWSFNYGITTTFWGAHSYNQIITCGALTLFIVWMWHMLE